MPSLYLLNRISSVKQNPSIVYAHLTKWPNKYCHNLTETINDQSIQTRTFCKRELHLRSINAHPNLSNFTLLDGSLTGIQLSYRIMNKTTMNGVIINLPDLIMNNDNRNILKYAWTIRMINVF